MNPAFPQQLDHESFYQSIDCVFLTHGHFDHTSGLPKLLEHNPDLQVVAQYELALILMQQGMKNVLPINIGGSVAFQDVIVTMVQAKHTSSYMETKGTPIYAGEAAGYIFDFNSDYTLYHSGEAMMDKDKDLEDLLKDYPPTKVVTLGYGEEKTFTKR